MLLAFGALGADYVVRVRRHMAGSDAGAEARAVWESGRFRTFLYAVVGAYFSVLIRCIYR